MKRLAKNQNVLRQFAAASLLFVLCFSLCGCAKKELPKTAEDIRADIAACTDKAQLISLHEQLRTMGEITREEYESLAALYKGEDEGLFCGVLYDIYRLWPGEDTASALTETVVTANDTAADILIDEILATLKSEEDLNYRLSSVAAIMACDRFSDAFMLPGGAPIKKTACEKSGISAQVEASRAYVSVSFTDGGNVYYVNSTPSVGAELFVIEQQGGSFTLYRKTDAGSSIVVEGSLKDGIMVGDFAVTSGSTRYVGTLDDAGHVKTAAPSGVSRFVYAVDSSKKNYLYLENEDKSSFVMNGEFWKIPATTLW